MFDCVCVAFLGSLLWGLLIAAVISLFVLLNDLLDFRFWDLLVGVLYVVLPLEEISLMVFI